MERLAHRIFHAIVIQRSVQPSPPAPIGCQSVPGNVRGACQARACRTETVHPTNGCGPVLRLHLVRTGVGPTYVPEAILRPGSR